MFKDVDGSLPSDRGQPDPRRTVLVCDDDRLVLATLSSGLRGAGFDVVEADNGDDAILLARQHRPDIALLDVRMNGKTGLDVAAYLRDYVGTPFMFVSAFGDDAIVRQARDFGALDYLVTPVDIGRVVPAVMAALQRGAAGQAAERAVASESSDLQVAIGILMERFRLGRVAAQARLEHLARQSQRSSEAVAAELVARIDASYSTAPAVGNGSGARSAA